LGHCIKQLGREAPKPLSRLLSARGDELVLEAALARAAGSAQFAELARTRFAEGKRAREAAVLAREWRSLPEDQDGEPPCSSDGPEHGSLESTIRSMLARERIPFTVQSHAPMLALAATGRDMILVAKGKQLARARALGIAVHEVHGHTAPRYRARQVPLASALALILRIGTARGVDEQEGLALYYEARFGHLDNQRKRALGLRHEAVLRTRDGAEFPELVRWLCEEEAHTAEQAIALAMRVFRGSTGKTHGAGRELMYITSYIQTCELLTAHPNAERLLASGQVATAAVLDLETIERGL
jgi:hypothetical protein